MVSLLTGSVISKFYGDVPSGTGPMDLKNETMFGNITLLQDVEDEIPSIPPDVKIGIVVTLTFLVGIVQVMHDFTHLILNPNKLHMTVIQCISHNDGFFLSWFC